MLALKTDLGQESMDRIFSYCCDLIAHNIEHNRSLEVLITESKSTLAPENWTAKALLMDELSEELEEIKIGEEIKRSISLKKKSKPDDTQVMIPDAFRLFLFRKNYAYFATNCVNVLTRK